MPRSRAWDNGGMAGRRKHFYLQQPCLLGCRDIPDTRMLKDPYDRL